MNDMTKPVFGSVVPLFDLAKLDLPNLDMPALREAAAKGMIEVQNSYGKLKEFAEAELGAIEEIYTKAAKGALEWNRLLIEAGRTNANAAFDYAAALVNAKSPTEVAELSARHGREGWAAMTEQVKAVGSLLQKLAGEAGEPIKAGVEKILKAAA
jgi:phasin